MQIVFMSDHTGYELQDYLMKELKKQDYQVMSLSKNSKILKSNYASLGIQLGEYMVKEKPDLGIAICGTGIGISISCNKVKGIICALCNDVLSARYAKTHNNANVIALGARMIGKEHALEIVKEFLANKFESGRHCERINVLLNYPE